MKEEPITTGSYTASIKGKSGEQYDFEILFLSEDFKSHNCSVYMYAQLIKSIDSIHVNKHLSKSDAFINNNLTNEDFLLQGKQLGASYILCLKNLDNNTSIKVIEDLKVTHEYSPEIIDTTKYPDNP